MNFDAIKLVFGQILHIEIKSEYFTQTVVAKIYVLQQNNIYENKIFIFLYNY
jgi:hypothetical protein